MNKRKIQELLISGTLEQLKSSIKKKELDVQYRFSDTGNTLLFTNLAGKEKIRYLLDQGVMANALNYKRENALFFQHDAEVLQLLIDYGAKAETRCSSSYNPLMQFRSIEEKKVLINHGAEIIIHYPDDQTRSHNAFGYINNKEELELLNSVYPKGFLVGHFSESIEPFLLYNTEILRHIFENNLITKEELNASNIHILCSDYIINEDSEKIIYLLEQGMAIDDKFKEALLTKNYEKWKLVTSYLERDMLKENTTMSNLHSDIHKNRL